MDIAELGIRVDSASAVRAETDLDRLTGAANRAETATERLGTTSSTAGTGMGRGAQTARMFSQQLSQVAQQGMATGNYLQALAIQLPDIAGGFNFSTARMAAFAGGIGILASVTLPLLISALTNASTGTAEAAAQAERLKSAYEAVGEATTDLQTDIDKLRFGVDEGYQVELLREQIRLRGEYNTKFAELQNYLNSTTDSIDLQRVKTEVLRNRVGEIVSRYAEIDRLLSQQQNRAAQLQIIEGQRAQAAAESARRTEDAKEAADRLQRSMAAAYGVYASTRAEASALANETARAAAAFQAAQQAIADRGMVYGQIGARGDPRTANQQGYGQFVPPDMSAGGGGGGGGGDDFADRLAGLTEELQTERDVVDAWYLEGQKLLADRRALEILGITEHNAAKLALEEEYQAKIAEIDAQLQQSRLQQVGDFFGAFASIVQSGGQRAVKAYAVLSGIQGTVSAYAAAIEALRQPGLTLWGRMAAYGTVLAAGLKGVAAIRSAGGVGGGGSSSSPSVAAQGGGAAATQTIRVYGISRDALYTGEMFERIFDGIFDVAQSRNIRVSFG